MEIEEPEKNNMMEEASESPDSIEIAPEEILQEAQENLQHNAPIQAIDLLLEANMLESILEMKEVDSTTVWKICQYLLRIANFHYEKKEKDVIYSVAYQLFCKFDMWIDRFICAIMNHNKDYLLDTYNCCESIQAKMQMCEIASKMGLSHLFHHDNQSIYAQLLSSMSFSEWFNLAAKEMEVSEVKSPDFMLSMIKVDENARNQYIKESQLLVNGLVNAGHCSESFLFDENGKINEKYKKSSSLCNLLTSMSLGCIYMWNPYEGLNKIVGMMSSNNVDVKTGSFMAVGLIMNGIYNDQEDISFRINLR